MKFLKSITTILVILFLTGCLEQGEVKEGTTLPSDHSPTPPADSVQKNGGVKYKVRMGDRYYLTSAMESFFVSNDESAGSDSAVKGLIKQFIFDQGATYSGACSVYADSNCRGLSSVDYQALPSLAIASSSAEAGFLNVCAEILDTSGVLSVMDQKLGFSGTEDFDTASGPKAFQLFYPGKNLPQPAYEEFLNLYTLTKASSDRNGGWKAIYYTLCVSPHWRIP